MPLAERNPTGPARHGRNRMAALPLCVLLVALPSCATRISVTHISLRALETAPSSRPRERTRAIVSDVDKLGSLHHPLNANIGIVQIRSIADWRRLNEVAPQPGPPPDFSRGIVVGVLSRAGMPIDGGWPASIESVQMVDSAGLLVSHFHSGCYLPDTTAYLESAFIEGLHTLLVVDIDDLRFYVR